jgi:Leucine-rich repeat (LRR) protein
MSLGRVYCKFCKIPLTSQVDIDRSYHESCFISTNLFNEQLKVDNETFYLKLDRAKNFLVQYGAAEKSFSLESIFESSFFIFKNIKDLKLSEECFVLVNISSIIFINCSFDIDWNFDQLSQLPNLTNIEFVNCSNLFFNQFPHTLTELIYKNCSDITYIPRGVFSISTLKELKFINCPISIIPNEIKALSNLRFLVLEETLISDLPRDLKNLHHLKGIRLTKNANLCSLPDISLLRISSLSLSYSFFTDLPAYLLSFQLTYLDLSGIVSADIFQFACQFIDLEFLILESCQISFIPEDLSNLKKLNWLSLANNNISDFHIDVLPELTHLDLRNNKLSNFPIIPVTVEDLYLTNNNISTIPSFIQKYTNLISIDLSYNKLRKISENSAFFKLPYLETLNLRDNLISSFPFIKLKHGPFSVYLGGNDVIFPSSYDEFVVF